MEVHFTPEQEAELSSIGQREGKPPEQLIAQLALSLLDDAESFRVAVREGLAQANAGNFIEEEEMAARFKR
jgi:predicted transcriptional regulator